MTVASKKKKGILLGHYSYTYCPMMGKADLFWDLSNLTKLEQIKIICWKCYILLHEKDVYSQELGT